MNTVIVQQIYEKLSDDNKFDLLRYICVNGYLAMFQTIYYYDSSYMSAHIISSLVCLSCINGHIDVVKWILSKFDNVNMSIINYHPIRMSYANNYTELADYLIQTYKNQLGTTFYDSTMREICERGTLLTYLHFHEMYSNLLSVNSSNNELMYACKNSDFAIIEYIVNKYKIQLTQDHIQTVCDTRNFITFKWIINKVNIELANVANYSRIAIQKGSFDIAKHILELPYLIVTDDDATKIFKCVLYNYSHDEFHNMHIFIIFLYNKFNITITNDHFTLLCQYCDLQTLEYVSSLIVNKEIYCISNEIFGVLATKTRNDIITFVYTLVPHYYYILACRCAHLDNSVKSYICSDFENNNVIPAVSSFPNVTILNTYVLNTYVLNTYVLNTNISYGLNNTIKECPICFNDISSGIKTICDHYYCNDCFVTYYIYHNNNSCAKCRHTLCTNNKFEIDLFN
jgi:hypothetical protein